MLSDKRVSIVKQSETVVKDNLSLTPKLIFSDMGGNVTLEATGFRPSQLNCEAIERARLPSQQIKQAAKALTPEQQYLKALYTVGEAKQ